MIWSIVVWATFLSAAGVPAAAPQAPVARARLDMVARTAANCTGPDDFAARVAARSPRIQFVEDSAAIGVQATFNVARSGGINAELILVESGVSRAPRRFQARSCAEAADALALMVAVALDPVWVNEHSPTLAGESGTDVSTGSSSAASATPRGPSAVASRPGKQPGPITTEKKPEPPPPPVSIVASPVAGSPSPLTGRFQPRFGAHLAGQSLWGPAPAVMPGLAAYAVGALDRDALLSPAIVLGAIYAWRSDLAEPGGKASFSLVAGSLDACVLRVQVSLVDVRACAAVVAGRLSASGSDTDAPATVAKLFAVAGATSILTVHLGRMIELSARIGTGMTLRRSSYEFGSTAFHTSSRLTTSASIGVGLGWW
jgi:hypothetical protein